MFDDDPTLAPEQRLALQAARAGAEIAANVPDRELAARIIAQVVAAFDEGARKGAAARAAMVDEPELEPGTLVGTVRTLGPDEVRARRWE